MGGPISEFVLDIWGFVTMTFADLFQLEAPAVHDACCVAAVIDPSVFTTEKADVRVELNGRWTKGMTVANFEKGMAKLVAHHVHRRTAMYHQRRAGESDIAYVPKMCDRW